MSAGKQTNPGQSLEDKLKMIEQDFAALVNCPLAVPTKKYIRKEPKSQKPLPNEVNDCSHETMAKIRKVVEEFTKQTKSKKKRSYTCRKIIVMDSSKRTHYEPRTIRKQAGGSKKYGHGSYSRGADPESSPVEETSRPNTLEDDAQAEYERLLGQLKVFSTRAKRTTYIDMASDQWDTYRPHLAKWFKLGRVNSTNLNTELPIAIDQGHSSCPDCMSPLTGLIVTAASVVTEKGLQDVQLACHSCEKCKWGKHLTPMHCISSGLWPLTISSMLFISFNLMELLSTLMHFSPSLSQTSIVHTLEFLSLCNGKPMSELSKEGFNWSMREWRRQETAFRTACLTKNAFCCPSCGDQPHCIHIDGNSKLYRYNAAGKKTQCKAIYGEQFLVCCEEVDQAITTLKVAKLPENQCGDWKAARTVGKKFAKLDETGLMMVTCRHSFILKALDMKRGEIYAYPYILQKKFPKAKFVALDTVCKYWPWLCKIDPDLACKQKPFLSVVHAKAHNWDCQVTWGGRSRVGAGLSTGETTELANSYMSRLGLVTRHMAVGVRQERIFEAAVFWNLRKLAELPRILSAQLMRAKDTLLRATEELKVLLEELFADEDALRCTASRLQQLHHLPSSSQRNIEMLSCTIQRLDLQIHKSCDSSKGRAKLRSKLSLTYKKLNAAIAKYCQENSSSSKEDLCKCTKTMIFPWTYGTSECTASNSRTLHLTPAVLKAIELLNLKDRALEEFDITATERNSFMSFLVSERTGIKVSEQHCNERSQFLEGLIETSVNFFSNDEQINLLHDSPVSESESESDTDDDDDDDEDVDDVDVDDNNIII